MEWDGVAREDSHLPRRKRLPSVKFSAVQRDCLCNSLSMTYGLERERRKG